MGNAKKIPQILMHQFLRYIHSMNNSQLYKGSLSLIILKLLEEKGEAETINRLEELADFVKHMQLLLNPKLSLG